MIHNKPTNDNNNIRNNNDNNINGPFDSWGNPSSAPYQNGNATASFTMAAFSGDGSSPEPTEVFPEKIEHDIIDLSNSPAVSSSSSTILSSLPFRPSNVHKQSPGVIVHTHTLPYILNIFGWSNKPSEMLSDVHLGSNKSMVAIYKHNNIRNNNDNNINGPFDSWGNPSSAPYQNGNTTASFTMAALDRKAHV